MISPRLLSCATFSSRWSKIILSSVLASALGCLLATYRASAQKNDPLPLVRSIYRRMNAPLGEGKAYTMRYTVHATMQPELKQEDVTTRVELRMSDSSVQFITKEVEVYQDRRQSFTVLPARSMIYLNDADLQEMRQKRMKMLSILQDTLFSMCEATECKEVRADGRQLLQVTMKMSPRAQAAYRTKSVVLLVDAKEELIRGMTVHYTSDSKLASLEMLVDSFSFIPDTAELNRPVASRFFSSDWKLLPRYRSYRVVDSRSKRFTK